MKKMTFIFVLFIIILSFSLFVFFETFLKDNENGFFENKSTNKEESDYIKNNKSSSEENSVISSGEDFLDRGNGKNSVNEILENSSKENSGEVPLCILVRPGNLPDITCSINYIHKDEISIRLQNKIGKDLGVVISINECYPEIFEDVKNEEEKSFTFSCESHEGYFNEQISISYIIDLEKRVDINGFVQGAVQSD